MSAEVTRVLGARAQDKTTHVSLFQFADSSQSICVFIKRTYELRRGELMSRSELGEFPLFHSPVLDDEGEGGEALFEVTTHECDIVPRKLATDIVVHGSAKAPGGRAVESMPVGVQVGATRKWVRVSGDRRVRLSRRGSPVFDRPAPFCEMPITWRRAFGGLDPLVPLLGSRSEHTEPTGMRGLLSLLDPEQHPGCYPPNPAGTGWAPSRDSRLVDGMRLPNIQTIGDELTPDRLLRLDTQRWATAPAPAGFGWVSQTWFPRSTMLGIGLPGIDQPGIDQELSGVPTAAPDEPPPLHFFNGASRGLCGELLLGGERVVLSGFHGAGVFQTALPERGPDIQVALRRQRIDTATALHTVELYPDFDVATLLWVARARPPQRLPQRLPLGDVSKYALLEDVDVTVDGVPLSRELIG